MTGVRVIAWLVGACAIGWIAVQVERVFYFSDSYDGLLAMAIACALALLTVATVVRFTRLRAVPLVLALAWVVPYTAVVPTLPTWTRTVADATAWALPGLMVLTLLAAQRGAAPWRPAAALTLTGGALAVAVRILLVDPFLDPDCWAVCVHNPLVLPAGADAADGLRAIAVLLVLAGLVETIRRRWERTWLDRAAEGSAGLSVVGMLLMAASRALPGTAAMAVLVWITGLGALAMAGALLARELRERSLQRRLTEVAMQIAAGPDPGQVGQALGRLLDDPDLLVRYWSVDRRCYLDDTGARCEDPQLSAPERTTPVIRAGDLVAVILNSRPTHAEQVSRAMGPAIQLALENGQLRAAALAELHELEASRHRILERAAEERRRLERNLHDGAQQRVVSLFFLLRTLAFQVRPELTHVVDEAAARTQDLLADLRRIARGIHPAVVADAGLADALADLAETSARTVVTLHGGPVGGLSPTAQITAYEFVSAALADAQAGSASRFDVRSTPVGDTLLLEVDHDAAGGSPAAVLEGQTPFVEALSGQLHVSGGSGAWRITMELPCVS